MSEWKVIEIRPPRPRSLGDVLRIAWGSDIFVYFVPLLKTTIAVDVIVAWWLS